MRHKGSVEDRVHALLSERLESIHGHGMFGQIPDKLQDVGRCGVNNLADAKHKIDSLPKHHPFQMRYHRNIGKVNWKNCVRVLDGKEKRKYLMGGW